MKKIKAEIIADSLNEHGQRCTTYILTYPRIIHAEVMTHRVFSRNAASSRAIPFKKMVKMVQDDPFVPIAFQKDHTGMQGNEYITHADNPIELVNGETQSDLDRVETSWKNNAVLAAKGATMLNKAGVTKQICNRGLETYLWYTCIVTSTEYDNFFKLRCPQYTWKEGEPVFKSKKEYVAHYPGSFDHRGTVDWLKVNKGAGEIHIMELAECMYDSMNESTPKQLKAGDWHIPFGDRFDSGRVSDLVARFYESAATAEDTYNKAAQEIMVKIATARCARVSYENFDGKDDYAADIKLYDRLATMGHMSPFEHCAQAMTDKEYYSNVRGTVKIGTENSGDLFLYEVYPAAEDTQSIYGWCGNFRGFIQERKTMAGEDGTI